MSLCCDTSFNSLPKRAQNSPGEFGFFSRPRISGMAARGAWAHERVCRGEGKRERERERAGGGGGGGAIRRGEQAGSGGHTNGWRVVATTAYHHHCLEPPAQRQARPPPPTGWKVEKALTLSNVGCRWHQASTGGTTNTRTPFCPSGHSTSVSSCTTASSTCESSLSSFHFNSL
jgi:hypothetical protein